MIKPKLKIGNKVTDDITREDYNKKNLKLNMIDCNSFKKSYLLDKTKDFI